MSYYGGAYDGSFYSKFYAGSTYYFAVFSYNSDEAPANYEFVITAP